MAKSIKELLKKMHKKKELVSLEKQDKENGVVNNWTSCYVKGKKVFVRGECSNSSPSSRNALLTITHGKTNKIIGNYNLGLHQALRFPK